MVDGDGDGVGDGVLPITFNMNVFRYLADISHVVSICILIWAIHSNRSAEGALFLLAERFTADEWVL